MGEHDITAPDMNWGTTKQRIELTGELSLEQGSNFEENVSL